VYSDWNVPTEFRFASLTESETGEIASVFTYHGLEYSREDTRDYVLFHVDGIESTWHLARVMHGIEKKADELRIEAPVEYAQIGYGGLNTNASTVTTVSIAVPRGASACIADGSDREPWQPVLVKADGTWSGEVRTDGVVADLEGWVYVAATRDGEFYRYFRVNVLTKQQQRVDFTAVRKAGLKEPENCGVVRKKSGLFGNSIFEK